MRATTTRLATLATALAGTVVLGTACAGGAAAAPLAASAGPVITSQPDAQTYDVVAGRDAGWTTTVNAGSTVQWQVSVDGGKTWGDIPGATSPAYLFTAASSDSGHLWRETVSQGGTSIQSNVFGLTVERNDPVQGSVWTDENGNRRFDAGTDLGVVNRVVYATPTSCTGVRTTGTISTTTHPGGWFVFDSSQLYPTCTYDVVLTAPSPQSLPDVFGAPGVPHRSTPDAVFTVTPADRGSFLSAGYATPVFGSSTRLVDGAVWRDVAANGVWDAGVDPGVAGAKVVLTPRSSTSCPAATPTTTVRTDATGYWAANLPLGCPYTITFAKSSLPRFKAVTYGADGSADLTDYVGPFDGHRFVDIGYATV